MNVKGEVLVDVDGCKLPDSHIRRQDGVSCWNAMDQMASGIVIILLDSLPIIF